MKFLSLLLLSPIVLLFNCQSPAPTREKVAPSSRQYYQLKTYVFDNEEQVITTDQYLKNAFLPGMKRLGISPIGVFKPIPNEMDTVLKTHVLIPFSTLDQLVTYEDVLLDDATYQEAGATYINASYDHPPYQRIQSIILHAFDSMAFMQTPAFTTDKKDRVYELRSYESATEKYNRNKVDMFNIGGEVPLFKDLQFNAVFYGEVISGPRMPNLMYMTTFKDQASRDAHWQAFSDSPVWAELKAQTKYSNNVSHADKYFLYPTDYSDY